MATLIYNNNTYVRWDKTDCDNYTITNLLDYSAVDVVVSDMSSDWKEEFTLAAESSNSVVLPADGVYKICAVAQAGGLIDEVVAQPTNYTQSVINIGQMAAMDESRILQVDVVGVGAVYQSTAYGGTDPDNNWTSPPTSYQSVLTTLNTWLNANGGGQAIIIPPGTTNPSYPWIAPDPEDYQLVFLSIANYEVRQVITAQSTEVTPVFHQPDIDCITSWAADLEGLDPVREYAVEWILDGINILPEPIYIGDEAGLQALFDAAQTYLNSTNGGGVANADNFWWVFENCSTPGTLTLGNYLPSEEECDYIYEFCDTYACITRLMQQWLCNPCPDKCDPNYVEATEARNRAIELSTLFFHALMPLVAQDRLWYLGNWAVNESRTCNVNEILGLYEEIRDFLKSCGFNCCDPCQPDCGCSPCDPLTGNYPTSKSDCGCNK